MIDFPAALLLFVEIKVNSFEMRKFWRCVCIWQASDRAWPKQLVVFPPSIPTNIKEQSTTSARASSPRARARWWSWKWGKRKRKRKRKGKRKRKSKRNCFGFDKRKKIEFCFRRHFCDAQDGENTFSLGREKAERTKTTFLFVLFFALVCLSIFLFFYHF